MHEHQPGAVRRVGPVLERAVVVDDVDDHEVVAGHRGERAGQLLELLPDRLELGCAVLLGGGARRLGPRHRVVQRAGHRRLVPHRGAVEASGDGEGPEPHPARVVEVAAVLRPVPALDGKALALGRVGLGHGTQAELRPGVLVDHQAEPDDGTVRRRDGGRHVRLRRATVRGRVRRVGAARSDEQQGSHSDRDGDQGTHGGTTEVADRRFRAQGSRWTRSAGATRGPV